MGEEPYQPMTPLPHWGELRPELLKNKVSSWKVKQLAKEMEKALPLSLEKLQELLKKGVEMEVTTTNAAREEKFQGLFLTDGNGEKLKEGPKRPKEIKRGDKEDTSFVLDDGIMGEKVFFYDEWDYIIKDYRPRWCFLRKKN